jgi:hypothetical protein
VDEHRDRAACSVIRKCSSTGKDCAVDDRACQDDAVAHGLEVICERPDPRAFVYCPPGAEQRDSAVVWILLAVAAAVAIVGALVSVTVLRRRLREVP